MSGLKHSDSSGEILMKKECPARTCASSDRREECLLIIKQSVVLCDVRVVYIFNFSSIIVQNVLRSLYSL